MSNTTRDYEEAGEQVGKMLLEFNKYSTPVKVFSVLFYVSLFGSVFYLLNSKVN